MDGLVEHFKPDTNDYIVEDCHCGGEGLVCIIPRVFLIYKTALKTGRNVCVNTGEETCSKLLTDLF